MRSLPKGPRQFVHYWMCTYRSHSSRCLVPTSLAAAGWLSWEEPSTPLQSTRRCSRALEAMWPSTLASVGLVLFSAIETVRDCWVLGVLTAHASLRATSVWLHEWMASFNLAPDGCKRWLGGAALHSTVWNKLAYGQRAAYGTHYVLSCRGNPEILILL